MTTSTTAPPKPRQLPIVDLHGKDWVSIRLIWEGVPVSSNGGLPWMMVVVVISMKVVGLCAAAVAGGGGGGGVFIGGMMK